MNHTRKMLRLEATVKVLLGICALLVIGFLLSLIGYLSFRGLFIRKDIRTAVLPDYREVVVWPEPKLNSKPPQHMKLWLSPDIELGKLRADKLYDILAGKEKNWVALAGSATRLTLLLSTEQLQSLARANRGWRKSRNIKEKPSYAAIAATLRQRPGTLAILPASWDEWQEWPGPRPRSISLAQSSLLLPPELPDTPVSLQTARALLEERRARTADYNWLTGQVGPQDGYRPVSLVYREYELLKIDFLLEPPAKNGKVGGISTMLLSSLILIFISLLWAVPLGLAVAVFLVEYGTNQWHFTVNMAIQTLSGVPSIIFGLFGSILFVPLFGIGLLSGAATLVLMLLPTIILTAKEALLTVPHSYIEASLGLGAQKWYTILHISLPCALPGILAGIILATGRALGETAALIYTLGTGYQAALSRFPQLLADWPVLWQQFWLSPSLAQIVQIAQDYPLLDLQSSLRSISLHLYWMTINGISLQKGFSTAFILIFLIVLLNMGARALLARFSHKY